MRELLVIVIVILLTSCTSEEGLDPQNRAQVFFDMDQFIENELENLKGLKTIQKKAVYDGEEEVKTLEEFDLKKELAMFSDLNINNPNWVDKYKVDTVYTDEKRISQIEHIALDAKLKVQSLLVQYDSGVVSKIVFEKNNESVIANSAQTLVYTPGKGYSIKNTQAVILSPAHELSVEVQFLE